MTFPRLPGRACPFLTAAQMLLVSAMAVATPKAHVGNFGDNTVSVIDTGAATSIAVGDAPRKIVVQPASEPVSAAGTKVSIADFSFRTSPVTIKAGDSVTWSNDDGTSHTVTFKDGSAGAKSIKPGASFTRTFDKPGTYDYFCSFHPYMTGRVVVR